MLNFLDGGAPMPPPAFPIDPPSVAYQLFVCILFVVAWFEMVAILLPERWREKIGALQFGPRWAAKQRKENQ